MLKYIVQNSFKGNLSAGIYHNNWNEVIEYLFKHADRERQWTIIPFEADENQIFED